jgi:hypothetical protein
MRKKNLKLLIYYHISSFINTYSYDFGAGIVWRPVAYAIRSMNQVYPIDFLFYVPATSFQQTASWL